MRLLLTLFTSPLESASITLHSMPSKEFWVAGRKSIARQLEAMRQLPRPGDVEFRSMNDLAEMARIASSYTPRLNPAAVRLSRIGRFIWVRLDVGPGMHGNVRQNARTRPRSITTNLVFRLATESSRPLSFVRPFRDLQAATLLPTP